MYKHLLEGFGFDVVMQFNEFNQKRLKRDAERREQILQQQQQQQQPKEEPDKPTSPLTEAVQVKKEAEEVEPEKENTMPEINRSVCNICQKEFSSIWVLKAHREEVHHDIVPLDFVSKLADDFRTEYDKKNASQVPAEEGMLDLASSQAAGGQVDGASPGAAVSTVGVGGSGGSSGAGGGSGGNTTSGGTNAAGQSPQRPAPASATPPMSLSGAPQASQQQPVSEASTVAANQMAAQLQFNQLLMSMGLGMGLPMGMNMPFAAAMNMHPPLIPVVMPPHMDPLMTSAFNHPMMPGAMDPSFFAAQQKLLQQQHQQLAQAQQQAQQQKRARTRISDEQLRILRAYFDINNSPTEEQLMEMSEKSGLPLKVIKHWFRNTLFKERQRNKDSPYNFNNPPSTYLNLEEYEKTGEAKVIPLSEKNNNAEGGNISTVKPVPLPTTNKEAPSSSTTTTTTTTTTSEAAVKKEVIKEEARIEAASTDTQDSVASSNATQNGEGALLTPKLEASALQPSQHNSGGSSSSGGKSEFLSSLTSRLSVDPPLDLASPVHHGFLLGTPPPMLERSSSTTPTPMTSTPSAGSSGKRANRTRFTDYQIKVLQEFFETNAYPKDDDLEYLSKLLNLSPRVIVVWFQNARQKARKVYENQPPSAPEDDGSGRFQRTPGLNYQCKKCLQVFQRYYELIKHQKTSCFKDENPLAVQLKAAAAGSGGGSGGSGSGGGGSGDDRSLVSPSNPSSPRTPEPPCKSPQNGSYRCDKCSLVFPRFDLWREHQIVHIMNPNLFPNYPPNSSFGILQLEGQQQQQQQQLALSSPQQQLALPWPQQQQQSWKRKLEEDQPTQQQQQDSKDLSGDPPRDKRLRTTILPEQLDYLYQKYQMESNPSRKMLENIARDVGLKKRVVQVWFQNTRARERKGQFRAHQQVIHKRCPFCRALFKARSALESHLATRHADLYSKGELNIDSFPDGDADSNPGTPTSSASEESKAISPSAGSDLVHSSMKKYYEDSLKKYLDEMTGAPTDLSFKPKVNKGEVCGGEAPLDLSKPLRLDSDRSGDHLSVSEKSMDLRIGVSDDARSETHSESTDNMDGDDSFFESNPTSPLGLHGAGGQQPSRPVSGAGKRFRTQMTTVQLKVMKSIFADYKTPSMAECEMLGREIGLPKRVVQVWFQNARAKEKKSKLAFAKTFGQEIEPPKPPEECSLCAVKYNHQFSNTSMQDHLFSKRHIDALRNHIDNIKKMTDDGAPERAADAEKAPSLVQQLQMLGQGLPPSFALPSPKEDAKKDEPKKDEPPPTDALAPYLYAAAGLPGYYPGAAAGGGGVPAGAFIHPTLFSAAANNAAAAAPFYEAAAGGVYGGTPLSLLALPASCVPDVSAKAALPAAAVARVSPEPGPGSRDELRRLVSEPDLLLASEVDVDVGFVCKKCQLVFPAEPLVVAHQRAACFAAGKPPNVGADFKPFLRLVQRAWECRRCRDRLHTAREFKFHCDSERHCGGKSPAAGKDSGHHN